MTLSGEVRALIEAHFKAAFSNTLLLQNDEAPPRVVIVDFMQYVKYIHDSIHLMSQLMDYFVSRGKDMMLRHPSVHTLIIMVDGEPLDAKRAVAHAKRHHSESKGGAPLATNGGPYLPVKDIDPVMRPDMWTRFAKNYRLLRRELYPRLFNAFMSMRDFDLRPGQRVVLSGFPGRTHYQTVHSAAPWDALRNDQNQVRCVRFWDVRTELPIRERDELADPNLYNRVYVVERRELGEHGVVRYEWDAACNNVSEGDIRMFWFCHWYENEHVILNINDGDVFSIGLLYAYERVTAIVPDQRSYVFRNRHTICLPVKRTKLREGETVVPDFDYVNLNQLYALVREYPPFKQANVQNPVATLVMLITLSGTDFCEKFFHGMGWQNIIWNVFFSNIEMFTHMVQISEVVPRRTRARRNVVVSESNFETFVRFCYAATFAKSIETSRAAKKSGLKHATVAQIRERSKVNSKGVPQADERYHYPDVNAIRAHARAALWVLDYWKNGPLGFTPDCMELWYGLPYYPYWRNPASNGEPEFITLVSPRSKPVDPVYRRNEQRSKAVLLKKSTETHKRVRDFMSDPDPAEKIPKPDVAPTRLDPDTEPFSPFVHLQ